MAGEAPGSTAGPSATGPSAAGKTVVVIDSGWSPAWNSGRMVYQQDFGNGDADARNPDPNTHGALVTAGLVANAPDIGIIALKVMADGSNTADGAAMEKALQWVVANADEYDVVGVNMSLASGRATAETTTMLSDEFAALAGQGVLTAVAGGNAGNGGSSQSVSLFGADPNVICVSASDGSGGFPDWAQRSTSLTDLCADGTDIALTNLAGQEYRVNGSSFAVPQVTAALALAQRQATADGGDAMTQAEFLALARSTGKPNGSGGYVGLDTAALLAKLEDSRPEPPPAGETEITVTARGSAAAGVNAHFKLLVDGTTVGEGTAGSTAKPFTFTAGLAPGAMHKVQVQFDNDAVIGGQDRNLFVESVAVGGRTVAANDPSVTYDKSALDGRDVAPGQTAMWWSGTLTFKAGTAVPDGTEALLAHRVANGMAEGVPAKGVLAEASGAMPEAVTAADWAGFAAVDPVPAFDLWADHHAA